MKQKFTVFYSWQSDTKKNKNFISNCIQKAIRKINSPIANEVNLQVNMDRDTKDKSGSPAIAQTIFDKISASDIFICDVSLINNKWYNRLLKNRLTSNPNVLMELGYAVNLLGWERIICINNLDSGKNEVLPFDLRAQRISTFNGYSSDEKNKLINLFTTAIKSIIENYDLIQQRHKDKSFKLHDKEIFLKIQEIASERQLIEDTELVTSSLYYNGLHYDRWVNLEQYYRDSINHFINKPVHESIVHLIKALGKFQSLAISAITERRDCGQTISDLRELGGEITEEMRYNALQNERYFAHKEPFRDEDWPDAIKRIGKIQGELHVASLAVAAAYKDFIDTYKKEIN